MWPLFIISPRGFQCQTITNSYEFYLVVGGHIASSNRPIGNWIQRTVVEFAHLRLRNTLLTQSKSNLYIKVFCINIGENCIWVTRPDVILRLLNPASKARFYTLSALNTELIILTWNFSLNHSPIVEVSHVDLS